MRKLYGRDGFSLGNILVGRLYSRMRSVPCSLTNTLSNQKWKRINSLRRRIFRRLYQNAADIIKEDL